MQMCQFNFVDTLTMSVLNNDSDDRPGFLLGALTPWAHAPQGGYDAGFEIKGIVFDMWLRYQAFIDGAVVSAEMPEFNTQQPQMFRVCGDLFVDTIDPGTGAPVSVLASGLSPVGPIVTIPPVADPGALIPTDTEVLPTRHLIRKYGTVQYTTMPTGTQQPQGNLYVTNHASFRWAARLRKRVQIGSRQGLFLGAFASFEAVPVTGIDEVELNIGFAGFYYYTLRRR